MYRPKQTVCLDYENWHMDSYIMDLVIALCEDSGLEVSQIKLATWGNKAPVIIKSFATK